MEVTQWFGPFSGPKYIGYYESYPFEADGPNNASMSYWDGDEWLDVIDGKPLIFQTRMWRGMVECKAVLDDLHRTDGSPCWCNPTIDGESGLVVHNSMDGRESYETGERKPH